MRYDMWAKERAAAEVLPNGLRVQRFDHNGKPGARIWLPKAIKPHSSYYYKDEAAREAAITRASEAVDRRTADVAARRAARKGTPQQLAGVKVGTIFHWSWGYDQTNCNFFQVVKISGSRVTLREIASQSIEGSEGFMCDRRVAVKDAFLTARCKHCGMDAAGHLVRSEMEHGYPHVFKDERIVIKRVQFTSDGRPYVPMKYGWCGVWEGKPEYCSWYA